ncbi:3-oxoacyl-reductase [Apiospora arundinis]
MASPKPFQGKVICITGAAQGIGKATANYLADRGATVSLADQSFEKGPAVITGGDTSIGYDGLAMVQRMKMHVDICEPESVKAWIEATVENFGQIDGCVNNAGQCAPRVFAPITETEMDDWNKVINVNLTGCFNCLKYELKHIVDEGSIVNVASVAGLRGAPNMSAYIASKHGVIGLTRTAAHEGAARKIRVNANILTMSPVLAYRAPIRTQMYDRLVEGGYYPKGESSLGMLISKLGEPQEVAASIAFFLSDETKFHTAVIHTVDGGMLK